MRDFVAHSSRTRIVLLLVGCAAFVSIGLWMVGMFGALPTSRRYPALVVYGIGWFSILFFGVCGLLWAKRLFSVGEELRIGTAGIRWARWSRETIPWSEISNVTEWSYKGQRSIILQLRNPAMFPAQGLLAWAAKANRTLTGGDIALNLTATNRTFDEAMAAIEQFSSTIRDDRSPA